MSWRYYEGPDGREFCFSIEPLFECPIADVVYEVWDPSKPVGSEKTITRRRPEDAVGVTHTRHVSPAAQAAADALGVDPKKLLGLLTNAHRHGVARDRVDGRLTDRCKVCGARMERRGFHAWVSEPIPEAEWTDGQRTSAALNRRLNGDGWMPTRVVKDVWVDTRREAKQWAYDECSLAKSVAAEAS